MSKKLAMANQVDKLRATNAVRDSAMQDCFLLVLTRLKAVSAICTDGLRAILCAARALPMANPSPNKPMLAAVNGDNPEQRQWRHSHQEQESLDRLCLSEPWNQSKRKPTLTGTTTRSDSPAKARGGTDSILRVARNGAENWRDAVEPGYGTGHRLLHAWSLAINSIVVRLCRNGYSLESVGKSEPRASKAAGGRADSRSGPAPAAVGNIARIRPVRGSRLSPTTVQSGTNSSYQLQPQYNRLESKGHSIKLSQTDVGLPRGSLFLPTTASSCLPQAERLERY
eukprot:scaffold142286_cov44-Prasinocladus_malaysianus.AAC.1